MKVLVIGNSGFVGGFLTKKLAEKGYEVRGMDVNPPATGESVSSFVRGSIVNYKDVLNAAVGCKCIINLAAKHHDFGITQEEFFAVNVKGTKNMLDAASELGIKKVIFYSTVAVYGNLKGPAVEGSLMHPVSVYGKSKLAAEQQVQSWIVREAAHEAVIIRPAVVFGPNNFGNMYNLINTIYRKRFMFVGPGNNVKSIAYVENLADATIFLLERMKPGVDIYNYTDYPEMTISKIVETILQSLSYPSPKIRIPLKPALALASIFDVLGKMTGHNFPITAYRIKKFNTPTHFKSNKIRSEGFYQHVSLQEGFQRMVDWYLENKDKKIEKTDGGEE